MELIEKFTSLIVQIRLVSLTLKSFVNTVFTSLIVQIRQGNSSNTTTVQEMFTSLIVQIRLKNYVRKKPLQRGLHPS